MELRLLKLPLVHFFETSFGRIHDKHFIVVRLDGDGATGFGECVAEQDPYYSAETNETVWHIIAAFIAPRVIGVEFAHPRDVFPALAAIRGHNMAKAAVEMAAWDLFARQRGEPLSRTLGGTRDRIASGVSIGIQDTLADLAALVARERAAGYQRIKIKVKPGWDVDAVAMIRDRFGAIPLMVDNQPSYSRMKTTSPAANRNGVQRISAGDQPEPSDASKPSAMRMNPRRAAAADDTDLSR